MGVASPREVVADIELGAARGSDPPGPTVSPLGANVEASHGRDLRWKKAGTLRAPRYLS